MAHRIIDNLSWIDHTIHQSSEGYVIELGDAAISSIIPTDGFDILLSRGTKIIISRKMSSFEVSARHKLDAPGPVDTGFIGDVLHRKIREAIVTPDGELMLGIAGLSADLVFESSEWKVSFPNGSSVVSLREGGIELLPPDSSS